MGKILIKEWISADGEEIAVYKVNGQTVMETDIKERKKELHHHDRALQKNNQLLPTKSSIYF